MYDLQALSLLSLCSQKLIGTASIHTGMQEETRFWPYTYMDCDFNVLFNRGAEGYCTGDFCNSCKTECEEWESFGHSRQEMVSLMKDMEAALLLCVAYSSPLFITMQCPAYRTSTRNIGSLFLHF